MSHLHCPHCGEEAISVLRKLFLGPALPARCRRCGHKVGVPYSSLLAMVPFLGGIFLAGSVGSVPVQAALAIGGFLAMSFIHLNWIPLEPR